MEEVHIGKIIREHLFDKRIGTGKFAEMIGQNKVGASRLFLKKELHSTLLLKISKVLGHNFFQYYVPELEKVKELEKENEKLKMENTQLKEIVQLLTGKK